MRNRKGATIVELIVSITVLLVIVTFLFQTVISLKEVYNSSGIKTEMLTKQALISKMINNDLRSKKIELATTCGDNNCIAFYFEDGTRKTLELIKKTEESPAYLIYGDYKTELTKNSNFGDYQIKSETISTTANLNYDSMLSIDIPIFHSLLQNQDYGINIVYQYDSKDTSITNLVIGDNTDVSDIYLIGSNNMTWYTTVPFEEPGYFYLDSNNNLIKDNKSNDDINVLASEIVNNIQTITYQSKKNPDVKKIRTITYIESEYTYELNNSYHSFTVPVSGTYKIELWGANGVSNSIGSGGKGAYTKGNIYLNSGEKIYIYVGGTGSGDTGGYNGGGNITTGQSNFNGAPGGGATDIRLVNGSWDLEGSLYSRIMVAAGGGGASSSACGSSFKSGGNGGTINSNSASIGEKCTDSIWTIAYGADQTTGGTIDVFNTDGSKIGTYQAGKFGYASFATEYTGDIRSGGGGGYYGGTSSGYGSFATGGSSFVSGCDGCKAIDIKGNSGESNIHYSGKAFSNIEMKSEHNLESDNGFAKISLVGVSYSNDNTIELNIEAKKANSKTSVATNTWSNEPLVFTITKNFYGDSNSKLYYCKDTTNTCDPNIETINRGEFSISDVGTYYIRYKSKDSSSKDSAIKSFKANVDIVSPNIIYNTTSLDYGITNAVTVTDDNFSYMNIVASCPSCNINREYLNIKDTNYSIPTFNKAGTWNLITEAYDKAGNKSTKTEEYIVMPSLSGIKIVPNNGSVTMTWDVYQGATRYRIQRLIESTWTTIAQPTDTTYTDSSLTNGITYKYRFIVYNGTNWTIPTDDYSVVPTTTPQNIKVTLNNNNAVITWNAVTDATQYRVQRLNGTTWTTISFPTTTTYTDSNLTSGTTYKYRVLSYVNDTWSGVSEVVSITP